MSDLPPSLAALLVEMVPVTTIQELQEGIRMGWAQLRHDPATIAATLRALAESSVGEERHRCWLESELRELADQVEKGKR